MGLIGFDENDFWFFSFLARELYLDTREYKQYINRIQILVKLSYSKSNCVLSLATPDKAALIIDP